ncbi:hypothetical protein N8I74_15680 [Chitiniphilus purpureus]|uniref:DUF3862 domain-containing protein n=1 Tax=Chitiniphilus purpureus TaxID=2981137 RepID=A0ABY6DK56_9NEIS|nr:hypothetical protein [Chitiniphilus sp. CD1]UXY14745.1 hypothetical protein N8I74_15680 [Chitiniphilus sp. CD1]
MRLIATCFFLLTLAACSRLSPERYAQIETGMTRAEVIGLLGEPDQTDGASLLGISGESAIWQSGGTTVTIRFVNDKVIGKDMEKR